MCSHTFTLFLLFHQKFPFPFLFIELSVLKYFPFHVVPKIDHHFFYPQGPEMPTRKLAKQAVALKACVRLHQLGELNDNLLPVGSKCKQLDSSDLFPLYNSEDSVVVKGQSNRGTNKRKQAYPKQVSACLKWLFLVFLSLSALLAPTSGLIIKF